MTRKRLGLALAVAVVGATVIAAGTFNRPAASGVASITIQDGRFTPNRIDGRVGQPITLNIRNDSGERHDLYFQSLHMPELGGVQQMIEPGESRSVTLTFDAPGYHVFVCSNARTASLGMTGAIFVAD